SFHDNPKLEIIWTIIPFLILVGLAVPATRVLIRMDDTQLSDVTVKVVGYQWKWQYQYLDQGISYFSSLSTP
ncbi:cytochrome c oxidase subunit II transmembrane domain-containing protein, partial [Legionella pneumophila]